MATLEETAEGRHPLVAGLDGQAQRPEQVDDRADLEEVRPQAPRARTGSSCRPTRCSWRRSSTSSVSITTRRSAPWCCVSTRRAQIQALDRSQPVLPMMPGMPERRTHDYYRHGITSLFAAFNIADGTVISQLHRRHRAIEFKKFLIAIDKAVPAELDVHLVCRQLRHPQDPRDPGLAGPPSPLPRALHPDRLQLDQPGRALVRPAHRQAHPPRRAHLGPSPGERHPRLDPHLERQPRPFTWVKTADDILNSLADYLAKIRPRQTGYRLQIT